MTPKIKEVLTDLVARLHRDLNDALLAIVLFGSQARGDATALSDIDVAVIVRRRTSEVWDTVTAIAADVSLEHEVVVSVLVVSEAKWLRLKTEDAMLARNIEMEGVQLWNGRQVSI